MIIITLNEPSSVWSTTPSAARQRKARSSPPPLTMSSSLGEIATQYTSSIMIDVSRQRNNNIHAMQPDLDAAQR